MGKFLRIALGRILYTVLSVAVQITAVILILKYCQQQFVYFYIAGIVLSVIIGLHVLNRDINPAYKVAWLIPLMLLPIFGGLLYILVGIPRLTAGERLRVADIEGKYRKAVPLVPNAAGALAAQSPSGAMQARYITAVTGVPPYGHTETQYLPIGEEYFSALKQELEKAERFIFLEYFIIAEGTMWNEILQILRRKAKAGVDVRVIYDDIGCVFTLPPTYDKTLEQYGIKAFAFHRFNSILNSRFNARDHRKICVIDGNTGFTGGINLADEYINAYPKHGHWKDTGILLRGRAVWSLTLMFLSTWDFGRSEHDDFSLYAPTAGELCPDDGYVVPFTDTPADNEPLGETVYMNIINRAARYVDITTPYLIIDYEMMNALRTAARQGVDVRIITPGIPDKKLVNAITKSFYEPLLKTGVRIYEYIPGFIHAKTFVSDDELAVVGTINLDYRSLYLHYECAAWLCGSGAVGQVKQDFDKTLKRCREIKLSDVQHTDVFRRIGMAVLRTFAPLL